MMSKIKSFLLLLGVSLSAANDFTNANNLFTPDIYKQVAAKETGNFLVSPFSAEIVLALVKSGAKGKSGEELRRALHLPNDSDQVERAVQEVLFQLKSTNSYGLQSANKLYFQDNFKINDEFKQKSTQVYRADSEAVDFKQNVDTVKNINTWVERETNNKIKDLIKSDDVNESTRAVLVNALYFKANWSNAFESTLTKKIAFHKSPTESVQVDALHHYEQDFKYYECPHLQAQFLELPFDDDDASFVVVLPKTVGLAALENQLQDVFAPQHSFHDEYLHVVLPKFKIESSIEMKQVLKNLGVKAIFDANQSDLSGIAGNKGDLYVSKVAQKTFIDVNEHGVEAASATYVGNDRILYKWSQPKKFVADRPFIFYIKIKGVIVFAGRVTDPKY